MPALSCFFQQKTLKLNLRTFTVGGLGQLLLVHFAVSDAHALLAQERERSDYFESSTGNAQTKILVFKHMFYVSRLT